MQREFAPLTNNADLLHYIKNNLYFGGHQIKGSMTMKKTIANVRTIRKRGKSKLGRISDQMNDLAWDLSEKNDAIGDAHTAKSIAMLDESLALMQRALGLLNSVAIDPEMMEEAKKPAKKSGGLFAKKKAEEKSEAEVPAAIDEVASDRAPIASIKPQA